MARIAAAWSAALNTELPATRMSAPASARAEALSGETPPSTSIAQSAIHFYRTVRPLGEDLFFQPLHPSVCGFNEFLTAESCKDRHNDDETAFPDIREEPVHFNVRIDRKARFHPVLTYQAEHPGWITGSIKVKAEHLHSGPGETFYIFFRMDYHQMRIKRSAGPGSDRFHNRKSIRDIRDESPIHNIQMEYVCIGVDHIHIFFQMQKISRQH